MSIYTAVVCDGKDCRNRVDINHGLDPIESPQTNGWRQITVTGMGHRESEVSAAGYVSHRERITRVWNFCSVDCMRTCATPGELFKL